MAALAIPESIKSKSPSELRATLARERSRNAARRRAVGADVASIFGGTIGLGAGILLSGIRIPLPGGYSVPVNGVAGVLGLGMVFSDNPLTRSHARTALQSGLLAMGSVTAVRWTGDTLAGFSLGDVFGGNGNGNGNDE